MLNQDFQERKNFKSYPEKIFINKHYLDYYEFTEQFVFSNIGSNKKVLDIGCRNGLFTERIKNNCLTKKIVAVDTSEQAIKFAKLNNSEKDIIYVKEDGENINGLKKYGKFDVIHIRNTFHHFKNPEEFLKNICKLLNKNGKVIIVDIDFESMYLFLAKVAICQLITFFQVISFKGIRSGFEAITRSGFFSNEYIKHRKSDNTLMKKKKWFKSKEIFEKSRKVIEIEKYGRLGDFLKRGGVYFMIFKKNEDKGEL